jgi:hypothetical protein
VLSAAAAHDHYLHKKIPIRFNDYYSKTQIKTIQIKIIQTPRYFCSGRVLPEWGKIAWGLNDGISPPPLQAAGSGFPSCRWRVQSPTDAYVLRGCERSPCPLKTSVQQFECAPRSNFDEAKFESQLLNA